MCVCVECVKKTKTNFTFTSSNLKLWGNKIGNEGARALAENKTITNLDLGHNNIGHEGARALTKNKTISNS